jgi:Icc-related predicted phosphoesterase
VPAQESREPLRIAAAGDIHCAPAERARVEAAFDSLDPSVDLVLLAGDLTTHGEPDEAAVLADICRGVEVPVFAVLGNHDWHVNRAAQVTRALEEGGIRVVDRRSATCEVRGARVGIAGAKGFVGGFPDAALPDFGEPSLRLVYAETTEEVEALDRALSEIAGCDIRIVLLHYSPTVSTLGTEPRGIWAFLGSDRLARPILEHTPDLVLHGHAHAGTFEGFLGAVPVYNVAVHVTGRDFWIFELDARRHEPRVERIPEPPAA